ncbi:putative bifunctional diguanylate cyclase/phosphodiesterase [Undibacterium sp. TJN25]|uniref:putative bifunctional diguanylate cyclase/phosphodiesterase n=1 Tax=Undibacterium sp. TJN25 TaxID=3413056 RepID=UPI003BF2A3FA
MPASPANKLSQFDQSGVLSTLLNNLDGMVFRYRNDGRYSMELVSAGCSKITGYPADDAIYADRPSYERLCEPEDLEQLRGSVRAALEQQQPYEVEYRITHANGESRWLWERGVGVYGETGQLEAVEGLVSDITVRKQADQVTLEVERRYRSIVENAIEGIFQSTPQGYLSVNPALVRIYGYASPQQMMSELRQIDTQLYVETGRRQQFMQLMQQLGSISNFESRVYRKDRSIIWISENARTVYDDAGNIQFYEGTVEDITDRKLHEAEVEHRASHDMLTGLPNRALLQERLQQGIMQARHRGTRLALAFLDIDQFKYINDSLGHQAGDQLLQIMSERLLACMRDSDTVARLGGDEFVLLLNHHADGDELDSVMQRIRSSVSQPCRIDGRELTVTCSIGISLYPGDGEHADVLLKNADAAMYKAKELGRNNYQYYAGVLTPAVADRLDLLNKLRIAIQNRQLTLHYQPKIDLGTGLIHSAEALIRWRHPVQGMISPAEFIPLAEETGLIMPIGEWVIHTACAQAMQWLMQGLQPQPIRIAVNISPRQLHHGDLAQIVRHALEETGLPPSLLELEITESMMMHNMDASIATLHQLKQMGVYLSVDDFGTGYASLSYLKKFPVDCLKIDQSFVRDIVVDKDDAAIVKAIISLGHILNLSVIAEGVETQEQARFLQQNACDCAQGYYFGRPMDNDAFSLLIAGTGSPGQAMAGSEGIITPLNTLMQAPFPSAAPAAPQTHSREPLY